MRVPDVSLAHQRTSRYQSVSGHRRSSVVSEFPPPVHSKTRAGSNQNQDRSRPLPDRGTNCVGPTGVNYVNRIANWGQFTIAVQGAYFRIASDDIVYLFMGFTAAIQPAFDNLDAI